MTDEYTLGGWVWVTVTERQIREFAEIKGKTDGTLAELADLCALDLLIEGILGHEAKVERSTLKEGTGFN